MGDPNHSETREEKFHKALEWNGAPLRKGYPRWQRLDINFTAFVYSAHFDDVDDPPVVRVIGLALEFLPFRNVTCRYFGRHVNVGSPPRMLDVSGALYHFRSRNKRRYIGAYVDCSLPQEMTSFPYAVSVYKGNETWLETNYMIIHYSHSDEWLAKHNLTNYFTPVPPAASDISLSKAKQKEEIYKTFKRKREADSVRWNITRCFPAFQKEYNKHMLLAQMVAASRALGVQRFVFYVESAGPDVLRMLKVLEDEGIAEVHPWNMHLYRMDLFYVGQFSAIQDCLYRHLWSSRFLLFGDVDELFVPRKHSTLMPLLQSSFEERPECGAFFFLHTNYNTLLATQRPPQSVDPDGYAPKHNLTMLTHVVRGTEIPPVGYHSKPAVDPHKVETGSVHIIQKLRQGFRACTIDKELGLLHHYRGYPPPAQTLRTVDTILWKYAGDIIHDIRGFIKKFNETTSFSYP